MRKAFAYFAFLLSGVSALWFVAGWVDSLWRYGLSNTVDSLLRWPAVASTVGLPVLAIVFLTLGMSLLSKSERG